MNLFLRKLFSKNQTDEKNRLCKKMTLTTGKTNFSIVPETSGAASTKKFCYTNKWFLYKKKKISCGSTNV